MWKGHGKSRGIWRAQKSTNSVINPYNLHNDYSHDCFLISSSRPLFPHWELVHIYFTWRNLLLNSKQRNKNYRSPCSLWRKWRFTSMARSKHKEKATSVYCAHDDLAWNYAQHCQHKTTSLFQITVTISWNDAVVEVFIKNTKNTGTQSEWRLFLSSIHF